MDKYTFTTAQKIYLPFKRLIGIFGSIIGIIVCFTFLWWWVFIINCFVTKGHPLFARHRIGKNGKPFRMIKFRSMKNDADPHMSSRDEHVLDNLTGFGKFLRASSIDETPQLFNILVGDMAFIGPRPLIDISNDSITVEKRKELGVEILRPGISGLAQIHHRSDLDPVEKANLDYEYLKKMSFWTDIKIFLYTMLCVFGAAKGR